MFYFFTVRKLEIFFCAGKCIAQEICIALFYNCKMPYLMSTLSKRSKDKNCSFMFDFVIKENMHLSCLQDLLLLYGYLCSSWCQSASLRHNRSRGHQHNLYSVVCEWHYLYACRQKTQTRALTHMDIKPWTRTGVLVLIVHTKHPQINSVLYVLGCTGWQGRETHSDSGWSGGDVLLRNCHDSGPQTPGLFNQVSQLYQQLELTFHLLMGLGNFNGLACNHFLCS